MITTNFVHILLVAWNGGRTMKKICVLKMM